VALDQSRLTQEGMLVGTASYMAPEQAMGRTPGARSDLYALGSMLYELTTGRPPFLGDDAVAVISQHVSTPPVAPSWHNPEIPPALEALIQQLLAKDPAARPQRAGEVAEALRRIEQAPAEAPSPPAATGPARDARRRAAWGRFVGRREELDQLKEALEDAVGGRGSLAMLVGEPGIGKTRLAEEFAVYARLRGAQVLAGRSYEGAVEVAYFPFVEVFRQYAKLRPDAELRAEELADRSIEVARRVGRPGVLAYALSARHLALGAAGRVEERLPVSRELLAVSTRAGLREYQSFGHAARHFDLLETGDAAGARAQLEGYVALAKQTREPSALWLSVVYPRRSAATTRPRDTSRPRSTSTAGSARARCRRASRSTSRACSSTAAGRETASAPCGSRTRRSRWPRRSA
jgi:hypothetical protein